MQVPIAIISACADKSARFLRQHDLRAWTGII